MTAKKYNGLEIFKGRTLVIATMHKKEKIISPFLVRELGVHCKNVPNLNTDSFGTFTGEVERKDNPMATVKAKALAALEKTNESLVVASEGSFGPHPSCFFISANQEIVVFIDTENNIEIRGEHLTSETNFNHQEIKNLNDIKEFEDRIGFPEHGIILRTKDAENKNEIWKDFYSQEALRSKVRELLANKSVVTAETDMRAMNNPTRMKAIEFAVIDLVKNIKSLCPKCNVPGFSISKAIRGLPCSLCNLPTKSVKGYIYHCNKCEHSCKRTKKNVVQEDPMYCDFCNP